MCTNQLYGVRLPGARGEPPRDETGIYGEAVGTPLTEVLTGLRYQRAPDAIWRRSMSAVLVVCAAHDEPLALEGGGVHLWEVLRTPASVEEVAMTLATSLRAEIGQVRAEVTVAIERLLRCGALVAAPASSDCPPGERR